MSLVKRRLLLVAVSLAGLLATVSGVAAANRFSIGEPRFRAVFNEVRFREGTTVDIKCPVTLEGSFHSASIAKVQGALVGFITRASVGVPCITLNIGDRIRFLATRLPWHIKYESFLGTLPNIGVISYRAHEVEFMLNYRIMGVALECLYRTTEPKALSMDFPYNSERRQLSELGLSVSMVPAISGGASCVRIEISGVSNSLTRLGAPERLSFILI